MEYTERFKQNILNDRSIYSKCQEYLKNKGLEHVIDEITTDVWVKAYVFKNGTVFREKINNFFDPYPVISVVVEKVLLLDENGMWEN